MQPHPTLRRYRPSDHWEHQWQQLASAGKLLRTIGREGGRALLGKWTPDGMRFIAGLTVDPKGKLWVMESDDKPKRISVWDAKTGAFVKEFFGPTAYGALGGVICPADPLVMVGAPVWFQCVTRLFTSIEPSPVTWS